MEIRLLEKNAKFYQHGKVGSAVNDYPKKSFIKILWKLLFIPTIHKWYFVFSVRNVAQKFLFAFPHFLLIRYVYMWNEKFLPPKMYLGIDPVFSQWWFSGCL